MFTSTIKLEHVKRRKKNRIFKFAYLLVIVLFGLSIYFRSVLPPKEKILPELLQEPIQKPTERKKLSFHYRGTKYNVVPKAEYELWGLVVTHNDIKAWYNFYHDKNSVNTKDLCVIWGNNIETGVYRDMGFKSGEWTCYPGSMFGISRDVYMRYKNNKLSNNHLITSNPEIRNIINNTNVGDQVHFKGFLASYGKEGTPEQYYRGSSMTRDDTGNGACETVYVEEMEILKKGAPIWYAINFWSKIIFVVLIIIQILIFLINNRKYLFRKHS